MLGAKIQSNYYSKNNRPQLSLSIKQIAICFISIIIIVIATLSNNAFLIVNGQQQPSINSVGSINLQSILEHQQALSRECQQLERIKLSQLKQVVKFNQENDQVYLSSQLPMQLPAVCLFLFGPPQVNGGSAADSQQQPSHQLPRLDLVNWIYDTNELLESKQQNNLTKRQTSDLELELSDNNQQQQPLNPLNDFFYNINSAQQQEQSNEVEDEKLSKFHQQMNSMIKDERFQQAIELSRPKLTNYLSPVVLVPGLLGSRLQGRVLSKQNRVNIFCSRQSDWQDLWLSLRMFLPLAVDCWLDNVRLEFDPLSGFTKIPAGTETRVPDFGSVESVRHLDLNSPKMTKYFNTLIERYQQIGYTPDVNLFAAPYDFRLAPQQLQESYFEDLKQLIEQAQLSSPGNKKITLVCHSMGCTHLLIFLRQQSAAWRQSRIRKLIALSSPWGGAIKALKALLVGDQLDLPLISEVKMQKLAQTYPSIAYLLPQLEIFSQPNKNQVDFGGPILVRTPSRQYRIQDLEQLMSDFQLGQQYKWFQQTSSLIKPMEPLPDLRVDCIHSLNVPTPETIIFRNQSDLQNGFYEQINGEGDGTVNHQSLLVCADWAKRLPDKVKHTIIMNTNHLSVLSHPITLTHITDDVLTKHENDE